MDLENKSEFTKNALRKLQEEMSSSKDVEEDYDDKDTSSNEDIPQNLLIQSFFEKSKGSNKKDILSLVLTQREIEKQKYDKMVKSKYDLQSQINKLEMQLHYNKLDLNNEMVSKDSLSKKLENLKLSIKEMNRKYKFDPKKFYMLVFYFIVSVFFNLYLSLTLLLSK